jgi:hypothetical protein
LVYTFTNIQNAVAGVYSPEKTFNIFAVTKGTASAVLTRGQILTYDTTNGGFKVAGATDKRPFKVVMTDSSATEATVSVLHTGEVVLPTSGAIKVGQEVMPAGSDAVKAWDGVSRDAVLGVYNGRPGEGDEAYPMTAAGSGSLGKIWLAELS